jgi:hypothetical protein
MPFNGRVKRTGPLSAPEEVFNILWSSMRAMCLGSKTLNMKKPLQRPHAW